VFTIRNWQLTEVTVYTGPAALICAFIGWFLVRRYEFKQVARTFGQFAGLLFEVVGTIIRRIQNALGMSSGSHKGVFHIKNYDDETESIGNGAGHTRKRRPKFKKWKDMDNQEKVRFIYAKRNLKHIKKGYVYKESATPNEVLEDMIGKKLETEQTRELYDLYNPARYKLKFDVSDDETIKLKHKFL